MTAILAGMMLTAAGADEPRRASYQIDVCITAVRTDAPRSEHRGRVVSEPRVITTSGRPASFRAGGTVPLIDGIVAPGVQEQTTILEVRVVAIELAHHRVWVETEICRPGEKRGRRTELEAISGAKQRFRVPAASGHESLWVEVTVTEGEPLEGR